MSRGLFRQPPQPYQRPPRVTESGAATTSAQAELATGTGAAYNASISLAPTAGAATNISGGNYYQTVYGTDGIVAYFRFDESTASQGALNEYGNHGAAWSGGGGNTYRQPGAIAGDADHGILFNETNSVQTGFDYLNTASECSVEAWFGPETGDGGNVFSLWSGTYGQATLGIDDTNHAFGSMYGGPSTAGLTLAADPNVVPAGVTHYVMTWDNVNLRLYRNGELIVTTPKVDTVTSTGNTAYIGGGHGFKDELSVYEITLTPLQVRQHYLAGIAASSINIAPNAGNAAGTGASSSATGTISVGGTGVASGTGAAGTASANIQPNAGSGAGTGAASNASLTLAPTSGVASGSGAAGGPSSNVAPNAGVATGTGTAYNADAQETTSTNAQAEVASGTGAALTASVSIAPNAGAGAGTGSAGPASASIAPNAGAGTGTGSAANASLSLAPSAGAGAGSGAAGGPTSNVQPGAGVARGGSGYAPVIVSDGPSAYWRFGEPSGLPQDSVGTNHVTSVGGSPTYGVAGALTGDANTAIKLDGSTEYFSVPDATALDLGDGPLSLELWIKSDALAVGEHKLIDKVGTGAYQITIGTPTDTIAFSKAGVAAIVAATVAIPDLNWHHIVATKNGSAVKLYQDGVDVTGVVTNQTLTDNAGALILGAHRNTSQDFFNGSIDEVAIYNVVLTPTQVANHYAVGQSAYNATGKVSAGGTGVASGTGSAGGSSASIAPNAGVATGTGAANNAAVTTESSTNAAAGIATGSGTAYTTSIAIAPVAGVAAGTGAALDANRTTAPNAGLASGTGAAGGASVSIAPNAGVSLGAASAFNPHGTISSGIGVASGSGSAGNASLSLAGTSGAASGSGSSGGPTSSVAPTAGNAAGTGTANNATITTSSQTNAPAGLASGTGSASNASGSIAPTAGVAAGSGSSFNASITTESSTNAQAGVAAAAGQALGPSISIRSNIDAGSGTGSAGGPSSSVSVAAGLSPGTGSAYDATVIAESAAGEAHAGLASGTGAAYDATIDAEGVTTRRHGPGALYWPRARTEVDLDLVIGWRILAGVTAHLVLRSVIGDKVSAELAGSWRVGSLVDDEIDFGWAVEDLDRVTRANRRILAEEIDPDLALVGRK